MDKNIKKGGISVGAIIALIVAILTGTNLYSTNDNMSAPDTAYVQVQETEYTFKNEELKEQHYYKHGVEMGFSSADEYEEAASAVVNNPKVLHKIEAEDGDDVYYVEDTNEFVIVSTKGYIRTYYYPRDGIEYFNRQ